MRDPFVASHRPSVDDALGLDPERYRMLAEGVSGLGQPVTERPQLFVTDRSRSKRGSSVTLDGKGHVE